MQTVQAPLVSVSVVTYNSENTIIETLDSIYAQTYSHIELIVSDDCSSDGTTELVRKWINEHINRFVRAELITVSKNTGVSDNYNRAMNACQGEWVKDFDGDDIMLPNCVEDCVNYVTTHPNTTYLFGRMEGFGRSKEDVDEYMNRCFDYSFFDLSANEQFYRLILKGNCVPSPTAFYNLKKIRALNFQNDVRIPMVEDYPKWIKLTGMGVKFDGFDKVIALYRLSDNSLSTTTTPSLRTKQSSGLIYIYYKFKPRYHYYKSPVKKLGEVRKYIHAANTVWGGWFWKTMKIIDKGLAKMLNAFGADLKK